MDGGGAEDHRICVYPAKQRIDGAGQTQGTSQAQPERDRGEAEAAREGEHQQAAGRGGEREPSTEFTGAGGGPERVTP